MAALSFVCVCVCVCVCAGWLFSAKSRQRLSVLCVLWRPAQCMQYVHECTRRRLQFTAWFRCRPFEFTLDCENVFDQPFLHVGLLFMARGSRLEARASGCGGARRPPGRKSAQHCTERDLNEPRQALPIAGSAARGERKYRSNTHLSFVVFPSPSSTSRYDSRRSTSCPLATCPPSTPPKPPLAATRGCSLSSSSLRRQTLIVMVSMMALVVVLLNGLLEL